MNGDFEMHCTFPDTVIAQASVYCATATGETIDQMVRDLQPPVKDGREDGDTWAWNAHTGDGGKLAGFPKIDWLALTLWRERTAADVFGSVDRWDGRLESLEGQRESGKYGYIDVDGVIWTKATTRTAGEKHGWHLRPDENGRFPQWVTDAGYVKGGTHVCVSTTGMVTH